MPNPVQLQQTPPLTDRHHDLGMRRSASGLARSRRHRLAGRLHSHRVRPLTTHRDALSPAGTGRVRVTSASHSRWLKGSAAAPGVNCSRSSCGLGPDRGSLAGDRRQLTEMIASAARRKLLHSFSLRLLYRLGSQQ